MRTREEVYAEIELKAETLQKRSDLTKAAVVVEIMKTEPHLYVEYTRAPHADPEPGPRPRETVAAFVDNLLKKKAVAIRKARNLSDYDAYVMALRENPKLVEAARSPQFAHEYVDELV